MLVRTFGLVAVVFFAFQFRLDARQVEGPLVPRKVNSPIANSNLGQAKPAAPAGSSDVHVDLSGIDTVPKSNPNPGAEAASSTLHQNRDPGLNSPIVDPLDAAIIDNGNHRATWLQKTGIERWTRHPGGAAAISLGAVLLVYTILRMMGNRSTSRRPGRLPRQVIELVGFVPLSPRQQLQLVRLGSKLVLVAVTNNGAEPLAEVTDPVEVDQILAACQSGQSALASAIGRWTGRQSPGETAAFGNRRSARAVFEA
jgi:flagellar biogenesis protein FliO